MLDDEEKLSRFVSFCHAPEVADRRSASADYERRVPVLLDICRRCRPCHLRRGNPPSRDAPASV